MKIITGLVQGSSSWHAHRATKWNASDAPAMLDESPHTSRGELLKRMSIGIAPEVDDATQRRFDKGHAVEKPLIARACELIGEPLHPFVAVADFDDRYSASFDGCTFIGDETSECKLLNARLRAAFADMETIAPAHRERSAGQCLPIDYRIQMEQQLRIAGAVRCLFLTGELRDDGTLGDTLSCWYYPDDALWARIQAGWKQFAEDLANYVPPTPVQKIVAEPVAALPAVSIRLGGDLTVRANLTEVGEILREFIARIPKAPSVDQEFALAEVACKALKKFEDNLDAEEESALAELSEVEKMRRLKADLHALSRTTRLATEKLVKARKEQMRGEEVARGRAAITTHVKKLNDGLGGDFVPVPTVDFGSAISGLKTIESIRAAVDKAVREGKLEAGEIAATVTHNQATARELVPTDLQHLLPDMKLLALKPADDFRALVEARLVAHRAAEQRRLETERERIRAEEAAKLAQEQRERDAQAQREREAAEALERREREEAATPVAGLSVSKFTAIPEAGVVVTTTSPAVVPMPSRAPVANEKPTIKLGDVCARLGITMTAAFVRQLGIAGTPGERGGILFTETEFRLICEALVAHVRTVAAKQLQAA